MRTRWRPVLFMTLAGILSSAGWGQDAVEIRTNHDSTSTVRVSATTSVTGSRAVVTLQNARWALFGSSAYFNLNTGAALATLDDAADVEGDFRYNVGSLQYRDSSTWQTLVTGGNSAYVQNQTASEQSASFRLGGTGSLNGSATTQFSSITASTTSNSVAVFGSHSGSAGTVDGTWLIGVNGTSQASLTDTGTGQNSGNIGVYGSASGATGAGGENIGVMGYLSGSVTGGRAVFALNGATGDSDQTGLRGEATGSWATGSARSKYAVQAECSGDLTGSGGWNYGVYARASGSATGAYGIWAEASGTAGTRYAGFFKLTNEASTTTQRVVGIENANTNTTTDGIDKVCLYVTSTGSFTGLGGTATKNYGLYVDTISGADANYGAYISGNVGIGTTTPGFKAVISTTNAGNEALLGLDNLQPAAAGVGSQILFRGTSSQYYQGQVLAAWNGSASTDSYLSFSTRGGDVLSERVRITSAGVVQPGASLQDLGSASLRWDVFGGTGDFSGSTNGQLSVTTSSSGSSSSAIYATHTGTTGPTYAVNGVATAIASGQGVRGEGGGYGVYGTSSNTSSSYAGVYGTNTGTSGFKVGVKGEVTTAGTVNYAIYGSASGATTNWAGYFDGNVSVSGSLAIFGIGEQGTPTATTIRGAAASGTNIAGADLTIDASNGTGTGGSGALIFRTAPTAGTGSSPNTLTDRMHIHKDGTVTVGTATDQSQLLYVNGDAAVANYLVFPNQNTTKTAVYRWIGVIPSSGTTTLYTDTQLSIGLGSTANIQFNPNSGYAGYWDFSMCGVDVDTNSVVRDPYSTAGMAFASDDVNTTAGTWYACSNNLAGQTSSVTVMLNKESSTAYPSYVIRAQRVYAATTHNVMVVVEVYYP